MVRRICRAKGSGSSKTSLSSLITGCGGGRSAQSFLHTSFEGEKMIEEAIGQRIRELRKARGETQESISNKAGISQSYFTVIESGQTNISAKTLMKVLDALEVTPKRFFRSPLFKD